MTGLKATDFADNTDLFFFNFALLICEISVICG